MGWPVSHSLSPRLHGFWLDRYGIDGTYEALPVEPDQVHDRLRTLAADGFAGTNVTVPHKEAALAAVDRVTDRARRIGAVNTVVAEADGTLSGDNTDGFGFLENLKDHAPDWRADGGPAVVLGAGGAARAIVAALVDNGAPDVRLVNRTLSRAETLAMDIGGPVTAVPWDQLAQSLDGAGLLVNTTSLGMAGKSPLEIALSSLPAAALVTDIVYTPLMTGLLQAAAANGNPIVDGIGMLLHQARPGFAAWFGVEPEVDDGLRRHVLAGLDS